MITAVIVILVIYLGVRLTLSEASKKLVKFRELWRKASQSSRRKLEAIKSNALGTVSKQTNAFKMQKERPTHRRTGAINSVKRISKFQKLSKGQLRLPFMDTGLFQGNELFPDIRTQENGFPKTKKISTSSKNVLNYPSSHNIINMFKVPTEDRNQNVLARLFNHVSFILQRNSSIEYTDVSEKVISSERVKSAVKTAVIEEFKGQEPDDAQLLLAQMNHKQRATRILQNMHSCISSFLLKIAAWVMYKLLGRILDGIEIHKEQLDVIARASERNVPIIYLPLHRSHLDYILVTFILYMNDLRAPLVAAGNNLKIPFFGALLRGLGAFFIKRKLDTQHGQRDFVYRAILHTYMEKSLKEGHSLEFFIEGGRSRTGKAVLPKAGLLSIVVDTLLSGVISDAYIVPISMSYEKLLDGNFISEQMGKPKQMESFSSAVQAIWRTLHSNFGSVRVDFSQPFSLKEFLAAAEYSYTAPIKNLHPCISKLNNCYYRNKEEKVRRRSEYGSEVVTEDHRQVIKDLADYVIYDAFNSNALMSTNILAFLMTTKHRKGATFHQLVNSLNWIREEIDKRNKAVSFTGSARELIHRAMTLLGKSLICMETIQMEWSSGRSDSNMKITFYKPTTALPQVLELQYYANSVLPVFLLESIVISSFYSLLVDKSEDKLKEKSGVLRGDILRQSLELCDILQYEFIFSPPGTSLCTVLSATIDDLISNGLLQIVQKTDNDLETLSSFVVMNVVNGTHQEVFLEEESDMIQKLQMCPCDDHSNMLPFLKCILSPFIESYWLVACTLPNLIDVELEEKSLLQEIRKMGQKKIHLGELVYEESLGLDTLINALKLLENWKILKYSATKFGKKCRLTPEYNSRSPLEELVARIEKYRR